MAGMTTRRWQVLSSMAASFAASGYHAVGMRQLAQELGLNPGTLYHHFQSKDHALLAICMVGHQRTLADLEQVLREQAGFEARLRKLFQLHVQTLAEIGDFLQVYVNLREFVPRDLATPLRDGWTLYKARQGLLFTDAMAAGEIAGGMDVRHGGRLLTATFRTVNQLHRAKRGAEIEPFTAFALDVLLNGLLRR